jgi:hypothetical protein
VAGVWTHRRLPPFVAVGFECGDDLVQVRGDLLVHLGDAGVPGGFGGGDELHGVSALASRLGHVVGMS